MLSYRKLRRFGFEFGEVRGMECTHTLGAHDVGRVGVVFSVQET